MSDHYETWREEVLAKRCEPMKPERIQEIFETTTIFGSSNGWTGTAGTLATSCRELLRERELMKRQIDHMRNEFKRLGRVYFGDY